MVDLAFREPVLARVSSQDGRSEVIEIRTIRDGLLALHRQGLGGYQLDSDLWQRAALMLQEAVRDPCPETADRARAALLGLACQATARLDS